MSDPVVAIVGSRDWPDLDAVVDFVERLARKYPAAIVVSGGARGVDSVAERTATRAGLGLISFRPHEEIRVFRGYAIETVTRGERAEEIVVARGYRRELPLFHRYVQAANHRNGWAVQVSDRVVAYWDGKSTGTKDTLSKAYLQGKPVHLQGAPAFNPTLFD